MTFLLPPGIKGLNQKWRQIHYQVRRNRGAWGGYSLHPQIFAKFVLLPIDNDSEKKKVAKNI